MANEKQNRLSDNGIASCGSVHLEAAPRVIVRGKWQDKIIYENGTVVISDWTPNQVQNTNATLLASLMKIEAGITGIQYIAVGAGLAAWDAVPPAQPYTQTTLTTEYFRKAIAPAEITFRDALGNLSLPPTNIIQIDVTLLPAEANGTQREFGIFGGNATAAADSGYMVNWLVHGRIDKDATMTIQRSVRFTFEIV
jgi:hypothetical protein